VLSILQFAVESLHEAEKKLQRTSNINRTFFPLNRRNSLVKENHFTVTTGTLEEIHWEVLPHPAYNPAEAPSDSRLFGPRKEALRGKIFRADDEVRNFCAKMAG
jgi:hypothetical protein